MTTGVEFPSMSYSPRSMSGAERPVEYTQSGLTRWTKTGDLRGRRARRAVVSREPEAERRASQPRSRLGRTRLRRAAGADLLGHALGQATEQAHPIPVRGVHPITRVGGALAIVRGHPTRQDGLAVRRVAHLWIDAQVSDQGQLG